MNLTEISDKLGITPSTVSQHIAELRRIGAITEIENMHVKKWKYYTANPDFNADKHINGDRYMKMKNTGKVAVAVIIIAVLVALAYTYMSLQSTAYAQGGSNLVMSLTDPPQVPAGTTSLIMSYSSVQAHVIGHNSSGWVNASGSGTLSLMDLINVSQVIGTATIPNNSSVNMLRFEINTVNITINGTTYNVTIPSSTVTAGVSNTTVNGTTRALIDFIPTIVTIYTQNSTVFVMVPSVRAVIVPGHGRSLVSIGEKSDLNESVKLEIENSTSSISIESTSLSVSNNDTSLSVAIHNNANVPVEIKHVTLSGNLSVTVSAMSEIRGQYGINAGMNQSPQEIPLGIIHASGSGDNAAGIQASDAVYSGNENDSASPNHSLLIATNGTRISAMGNLESDAGVHVSSADVENEIQSIVGFGEHHNIHVVVNSNGSQNESSADALNGTVMVGIQASSMRVLTFIAASNGTLVLPFSEHDFEGNGFEIAPNSTATLSFNGTIELANGHIELNPIVNQIYGLTVQGEEGAVGSTNVTAG